MITKLKLKNWRSHADSELDFMSGTNALLGSMGSGKTSCMDSICFALFGTFPTLQSKKLKLEDIIMKKPVEKIASEVEIFFNVNSAVYSVKRIIEKGKGTTYAEVRENGKLLEAPNSQRVNELIEKILKVDYDLFSKAIYSEQNGLDYFMTIPRGQRMKKIDELLMIDKFEKARTNAVSVMNKIIERKITKQNDVEKIDLDNLQKAVDELKNSLRTLQDDKLSLQKNLESVTVEKVQLEKEVLELQKIRQIIEGLKKDERGLTDALQENFMSLQILEKDVKNVDRDSLEKTLQQINKFLKEFDQIFEERQQEYQKKQEQVSKHKAEVEFLKKEKISKLEKEFEEKIKIQGDLEKRKRLVGDDVEKQINLKKLLVEKIIGEMETTKVKIKEVQELVEEISNLEGKCPICESKLTEEKKKKLIAQKKKHVERMKDELNKIKKKKQLSEEELRNLEDAAESIEEMLEEIEDFENVKTDLENSKNIFTVLNESYAKYSNELNELKKEISAMQSKYKEHNNAKQKMEMQMMKTRDYEDRLRRIEMLTREREGVMRHLAEIESGIKGKETNVQEEWLRNLVVREKEIVTKILGFEQLERERRMRLNDFENAMGNAIRDREEIRKLDKLVQDLRIFEKSLEQTQVSLRTEFVTAVNYAMNNLWPTLYPYEDFSGIKLSIDEGDYVMQLQERSGKWMNVEGIASGGERSIACLALRIAFSLVLAPHLRLMVLDEPTHNLDQKAVEDLAETLRTRINEFVDQIFLITHDPQLEDAVTGSLYRLERDKGRDGVTKVVSLN